MQNQKVRLTKTVLAEAKPAEREYVIWVHVLPALGCECAHRERGVSCSFIGRRVAERARPSA